MVPWGPTGAGVAPAALALTLRPTGQVVFFPADLPEADLRALITVNAGDNLGPRAMQALYPNRILEERPAAPSKDGK